MDCFEDRAFALIVAEQLRSRALRKKIINDGLNVLVKLSVNTEPEPVEMTLREAADLLYFKPDTIIGLDSNSMQMLCAIFESHGLLLRVARPQLQLLARKARLRGK